MAAKGGEYATSSSGLVRAGAFFEIGEELPYLFVPDPNLDIARRCALLRNEEHPHGGFYYRSFWIVNREGIITYKSVPWKVDNGATFGNEEHQQIFILIGGEPGNWIATCGLKTP